MNTINKITFIDIDETLFFTKAKIHVKQSNKLIKKLTNQEFNNYKLQEDEEFDFIEFRDAELFAKTSTPNYKMIRILNELEKDNQIVLLTAREDFDNKETFIKYLKLNGIDVGHYKDNKIHVVRSGNIKNKKNTADAKIQMIDKITQKYHLDKITFYDDCIKNLKAFEDFAEIRNIPYEIYKVHGEEIVNL